MTDAIEIVVAGEPVAKGRPRFSRARGVAYTPAKTRNYENLVKLAAGQAMDGREPLIGPVAVSLAAYLPIPQSWSNKKRLKAETGEIAPAKRPDIENLCKSSLDGCNGVVFADDSQVVKLRAEKAYSLRPRLEIRVEAA